MPDHSGIFLISFCLLSDLVPYGYLRVNGYRAAFKRNADQFCFIECGFDDSYDISKTYAGLVCQRFRLCARVVDRGGERVPIRLRGFRDTVRHTDELIVSGIDKRSNNLLGPTDLRDGIEEI